MKFRFLSRVIALEEVKVKFAARWRKLCSSKQASEWPQKVGSGGEVACLWIGFEGRFVDKMMQLPPKEES